MKVKIDAEILTCDVRKKPNQAPFVSIQFFDGEGKVRDGYGILDQNTSPDLGKLSRNDRVILAGDVYVKEGRLKLRLTGLEPA